MAINSAYLGFRASPELKADLTAIAKEDHRTVSNVIVRALQSWVDRRRGVGQDASRAPGGEG